MFLFCKFDTHEHTESVSLQGYPNRPALDFLDGAGFVLLKAQIAHSCNGLLLCKYRYLVRYRIYSSDHYLVCNPTTKTHALIPDPPAFSSLGVPTPSALRAFLAFDPLKSPRYKVVFMGHDPDSEKLYSQIDVYCSKRASWKQIQMMIETENPLEVISLDKIKYFGECGGRLILNRDHPWSPEIFRIFEMDKDYSCWVMKFWVKLRPLLSKERNISDCSVQCVVKGDKEKDFDLSQGKKYYPIIWSARHGTCFMMRLQTHTPPAVAYRILEMDKDYCHWIVTFCQVLCNAYIDHYLVCNPTTQKYTVIPEPGPGVFSSGCIALLAFDPSKSPGYKVVFLALYPYVENPYVQIDIYCSESASWKQIRAPCRSLIHPVFCSGVIYWLGHENVVSGFDVDSAKMIEMKKPLKIHSVDRMKYFGEGGGRLILFQTRNGSALAFDILEMDNDYCCWIVKCRVSLGPLRSVSPQLESEYRTYSVLCVLKGETEKDFAIVLTFPDKTIYYNLKCNSWNVLSPVGSCDSAFPFAESLYPL
ncbi:hypothetical protein RHSIM_Rhsim01G0016600 [Rhododendron simsii]|uniref:F-box associated beta-propeller type 3 domain-containing protein n=1 Tax=Rhododendron simsii TaxID=118357 RepID=A0A834HHM2_RHOSS|nr:hypothetical protein RHSIM_Rhsim01G0016600 [Rhododendron simsii]